LKCADFFDLDGGMSKKEFDNMLEFATRKTKEFCNDIRDARNNKGKLMELSYPDVDHKMYTVAITITD
jgi:hypothetical protein